MSAEDPKAFDLLAFWFDAGPDKWFASDPAFDTACSRFADLIEQAGSGALDHWHRTAAGSLACIIALDQLPRNLYRGTARAFANGPQALAAARAALGAGHDRAYPMPPRQFFYLPFEHSEDLADQELSLDLYRATGDREAYLYAFIHHDAIRRFGRFPHRNEILGRESTPDERIYLASGGFGG